HNLGDEQVEAFAAIGITARVYRGRDAEDPDAPGEEMCRDGERVALIEDAGGRVSSEACFHKGVACQFYEVCGYQRQRGAEPDVWIIPHQLLFKKRRGFIGKPDVLVIDESFWNATLHGTDKPYRVPVDELLVHREVPLTLNGTADLRAISHKLH